MIEMLVYILIAVSDPISSYVKGNSTVIGYFKSAEQCEHVRKNIPLVDSISAKCIQTNILLPK